MRSVIAAIEGEYLRYKSLGEAAIAQLAEEQLHAPADHGNSVATLMQHLGGNLKSRFTDFLTSDGEKPWRDREGEFEQRRLTRDELTAIWNEGWSVLLAELARLSDAQLQTQVTIRGVPLSVMEALTRSLAHASYHVGQMVLLARTVRGSEWKFLSIPPGGSAAYNAAPDKEKPSKANTQK
jgi:uncharacterized damage-inducible protein DinB